MAKREDSRSRLSKAVLEMKFMKKTKERVEKEQEAEDGQAMFSNVITPAMRHKQSMFIIEPSYVPCEDLIEGRLSYHGMNPEIEEIMKAEEDEIQRRIDLKNEKDVSDQEMANVYSSIMTSVNRKFSTKKDKRKVEDNPSLTTNKKLKFLKPPE